MKLDYKATAKKLSKMDNVLILCHRNPDGDTLGSGYGLLYALKQLGKKAKVICNDEIPKKFEYLKADEESFSPSHIVSVDIASEQLFGDKLQSYTKKVELAIDHHPSNSLFAENTLLIPDAAATCEIIYNLISEMGVTITKEIADCLYTGIATDTGCFKFSNVTPETHFIAGKLILSGADFKKINKDIFETKSLNLIELESKVLNTLRFYCENKVAIISVTLDMLNKTGILETELDAITGIPRQIEGVLVGITIKQRAENEFKISVRSSEEFNASEFCAEFGGGGHIRAAGCTIYGNLEEVTKKITDLLSQKL